MGCGSSLDKRIHEFTGYFTNGARRRKIAKHREAVLIAMKQQYSAGTLLDDQRLAFALNLLSEMPVSVVVWSEEGEVLHANGSALELLGHDEKTLRIGNHIHKLLEMPPALGDDWTMLCYKDVGGIQAKSAAGERIAVRLYTTAVDISEGVGVFFGILTADQGPFGAQDYKKPKPQVGAVPLLALEPMELSGSEEGPSDKRKTSAVSSHSTRSSISCRSRTGGMSPRRLLAVTDSPKMSAHNITTDDVREAEVLGLGTSSAELSPRAMALAAGWTAMPALGLSFNSPPAVLSKSVHFSRSLLSEETCMLLDACQHPAMILGFNGQILHWNPAAEHVYGPSADDMFGHSVTLLVPEPYCGSHDRHILDSLTRLPAEGAGAAPVQVKNKDRLSGVPRSQLRRETRDVVARTLTTQSQMQMPSRDPSQPEWKSEIIPVRLFIAEYWANASSPYWICMTLLPGERSKPSTAHRNLLRNSAPNHPDHPAVVPSERPALDPRILAGTGRSIGGASPRPRASPQILPLSQRSPMREGTGGSQMRGSSSSASSPPGSPVSARKRSDTPSAGS